MSLSKRILALITIALAGCLAISCVSLILLEKIQNELHYLAEVSLPASEAIAVVDREFLLVRRDMATSMLSSTTPDSREKLLTSIQERYRVIDTVLSNGFKNGTSSENNEGIDKVLQALRAYREQTDPVLDLIRRDDMVEAQRLYQLASIMATNVTEMLQEYSKTFNDQANQHTRQANENYETAFSVTIIIMVIVIFVVLIFGLTVLFRISKALRILSNGISTVEESLDFTQRIAVSGHDEVTTTIETFNRLLSHLQDSLRIIARSAEEVDEAASQVSSAARQMSSSSSQQSESATNMAAAMEEMTVSINHVADRASEASRLSEVSGQHAVEGRQTISQTVSDINQIASSADVAAEHIQHLETNSEYIGTVIAVIKEVADQTNLLALNAAIEAARAGEQGRGFAVVADEVRKLAERTTSSTHEISDKISEIQASAQAAVNSMQDMMGRVQAGVERAGQADTAIRAITESASDAVEMVGDITAAIREQSAASTSIAQQVETIAQMTESNTVSTQQTAETAEQLEHLAHAMKRAVNDYRV